jgi:hypothetical protein
MTNLIPRLGRVERKAGERPCPALGRLPRCALVETGEQYESLCLQMVAMHQSCTCGRGHPVKLIALDDRASLAASRTRR